MGNYEIGRTRSGLRLGFTTGSCAAAAAKAAAGMLFSGEEIRQVRLMTPKGIELYLDVEEISRSSGSVRCGVRKYSGDDPDVTDGLLVLSLIHICVLGIIVLIFQAVLLAHGGLTTLGANTFSMAVAGPLAAFGIYKLCGKLNVVPSNALNIA